MDPEKTGSERAEAPPPPPRDGVFSPPVISVPKGGAAIQGIGEKFAANPVTGTGSTTFPLAITPGRSGFGPKLALSYDSGSGNGPFGFGWSLALPSITRKTDKGIPQYLDADESDVFILSGTEDLQPVQIKAGGQWVRETPAIRTVSGVSYRVDRYRPRVEGLFARIERWTQTQSGDTHWRSISRDNVTTLYGKDADSRIADPEDPSHVFSWLICETADDKGNVVAYEYARENSAGVDTSQAHEQNRTPLGRTANLYPKRIKYGNRVSRVSQPAAVDRGWMFEVVFDYDEDHYQPLPLNPVVADDAQHRFARVSHLPGKPWTLRPDPFSRHRSGFEVRTYRRCRRVLMFHRFPELGAKPCLVRSTELEYEDLDYAVPVAIDAELAHQGSTRFASFVRGVTQAGFVRDETRPVVTLNGVDYVTYLRKDLPPLEFEYSKARIQDDLQELDDEALENLPAGIDGNLYRWVDLDGEGVSGVLTEQAGAWFYKPNLGDGRFGPLQTVRSQPSLASLGGRPRQQLMDLAGDGQLDLVTLAGPAPGFYERTADGEWETFEPFRTLPNAPWEDPNLRLVDLNGDGHADVLITEHQVFTWHPSRAEEGFGAARRVVQPLDEEKGPRLVVADGTQSIYLADMCGDGLTALVRIRNGEVCYWPSLGYGRFGARVVMDNAPRFDTVEEFTQQRVRLADIDGSGANDIIYLGRAAARLYFNQSGNRLSDARPLEQFPRVDDLSSVATVDLLGNGTACLLWSSTLPGAVRRPMRYIDLMGGQKPHLLVKTINNLGAETVVRYAPSTRFYLADKAAGTPWITRLPFPVHVVDRVETYDRISRNRFVTRYAYHHGYFDGREREFRGFGLVEQWDTEDIGALTAGGAFPIGDNVDESSAVPPVHTKTWFHTGVYLGRDRVSNFFAGLLSAQDTGEYYREPGLTDAQALALLLDDTELPDGLTVDEERDACRALKGSMLRQEVYALDGTAKQPHPYRVTEQNFTIAPVQGRGDNRYAIFFTHPREVLTYHYERNPADPRVSHSLTIEVDAFGNVLKTATVAYGRRQPDLTLAPEEQAEQARRYITYTENGFTNAVAGADDYRAPSPSEARTYELTGLVLPPGTPRFTLDDVTSGSAGAATIAYEQAPTPAVLQKRLIEHVRTLYRRDDLTAPLPFGQQEARALPYEHYELAFTSGLVPAVYAGRVLNAMLQPEGGYVHSQGDANWWIPSGRILLSPDPTHNALQELAHARQHFFLSMRYRDPFHTALASTESFVRYDAHDLLISETVDAAGNRVTVGERSAAGIVTLQGNNYRVLQPELVMDANRNRTAVAFDTLGLVAGTAVMGKPAPAAAEGDSLAGFDANLTSAVIAGHLATPLAAPQAILGHATTRIVHDVFAYQRTKALPAPQCGTVYTLSRETHDADPIPAGGLKIQHAFSYTDGFGRIIQKKEQAEPGPVPARDAGGQILLGADNQPVMTAIDVSPRWVGSGWTVFNNKGKPVRQYEPFFTDRHTFEFDVRVGVSPVLFYDPAERTVGTLHPDHTWEKVIFDAWSQQSWDASDTVLAADPKTDAHVGEFFRRLPNAAYLPTWHAQRQGGALGPQEQAAAAKAAIHASTPTIAHADSLGRTFFTVVHNRFKYSNTPLAAPPVEERYRSRVIHDIEGNERAIHDANDRVVMRYDYDMLGHRIHQASMEAGERWTLNDAVGKPLYSWDSQAHRFRTAYDAPRRPTESFLQDGFAAEAVIARTVYGETQANPEASNLRTKTFQVFDQAGIVTSIAFDFKGNLLRNERQLAQDYKATLDWSGPVPLRVETYRSRTGYDALNRPVQLIAPHSDQPGTTVNTLQPAYNEAKLLQQLDAWLNQPAEPAAPLNPATANLHAVTNIDYNAKGQRTQVDYGNGVRTTGTFDPLTFRLTQLLTRRDPLAFPDDCPQPPPAGWPGCQLQNLRYTYDPSGNITHIRDSAQQTRYFRNKRVEPGAEYTYDATYRLIEATGREHLGQIAAPPAPASYNDEPRTGILLSAADGNAMARYLERYLYDAVGNFKEIAHVGTDPVNTGWTRTFHYDETSQLEPLAHSNRLSRTVIGGVTTETYSAGGNGYDAHGNMLRMPHLQVMEWDFKNELQMIQRQAVNAQDLDGVQHHGERTWYVYDANGQRVRKVTELAAGQVKEERIYLGGFEVYRRHGVNALTRETLHVLDGKQRVALVETRTDTPALQRSIRFQHANHLGSANLELDDQADIVSYEEYTPYGSTSYRAVRSQTEAAKRYRYTGKERDEESGLYYHGARYYVPWLGRWTACDPSGLVDGPNVYLYGAANPLRNTDPDGRQDADQQVVSLGLWRQEGRWVGLWPPSVPPGNVQVAQAFLAADAARNTGLQPILLTQLPGWSNTWLSLGPVQGLPNGQYSGLASGVGVQQAFEGGFGAAIHFDVTGVQVLGRGQAPGELRNVITTLQTEANQHVDVHITENGQVSTIPRGTTQVVGAPLPQRIAERLPNIQGPQAAPPPAAPPSPAGGAGAAATGGATAPQATGGSAPGTSAAGSSGGTSTRSGSAGTGGGSASPRSGSGGSPGASALNTAGNAATSLTRAVVPGVAEAEVALAGGAVYANAAGYTAVGAALETGAAAVPIVGGGLLAGATVGNLAEAGASKLGATREAAQLTGATAAMLAGAGVGALIGSPTVIGAPVGAAIGALAGLAGYALSKWL